MARVVVDQGALATLLVSPAGPVGAYMARGGAVVAATARGLARVDTGAMQHLTDYRVGNDGSCYVDVGSGAASPKGFPYPIMYWREFLLPAMDAWPT